MSTAGSVESRTLRALIDLLPVGVAISHDSGCRHVELNSVAAEMLGVPRDLPLSMTIDDVLAFELLLDGNAIPINHFPLCHSAHTGETLNGRAVEVRRADGRLMHLYAYATPIIEETGLVSGCVSVLVDVTEYKGLLDDRRRAGERFAVSLDMMPDPFAVLSVERSGDGRIADFTIQYINVAGAKFTDRIRDKLLGERVSVVIHRAEMGGVVEALEAVVETGEPLNREFVQATPAGDMLNYECRANRLGDGVVVLWRETTSIHHTESVLRENEAHLRQLNETLEERVLARTAEADARAEQLRDLALDLAESESRERKRFAQMLHDHFQQLVSAAKMRAGIIRRRAPTDELRDAMQQIEQLLVQAIDASRSLVTQLSPPVLHDVGLVAALESLVRATEREHSLSISFTADPNAEPKIESIRLVLFEAARELLSNIVQHSQAKTARISIDVQPGGTLPLLRIRVEDDGRGFDVLKAEEIRDRDKPFGLLRIRERIRYLGGDLRVESEMEKGSVLELTVPSELRTAVADIGPAAAHPKAAAVSAAAVPTSGGPRRLRIVVADDHRLFRDGLTSLLAHEPGLHVVGEAADGEAAINLTRDLRPDVLICDISMPKRNGVEVTAQLSREFPELKIIGLSMHEREDMANAMRAAGASAYLTKSGPTDLLLGVLRTFVVPSGA